VKKNKAKQKTTAPKLPASLNAKKTKVPPPCNLTPALCDRLRRDLLQACLNVAESHGLTVEGGDLSDIDLRHGFDVSFRVGIPMDDGAIYDSEKMLFEALAPQFGLTASDYGRTFTSRDTLFRVVAIHPTRPKYPISVVRVADGQGFKFPAEDVALFLEKAGEK